LPDRPDTGSGFVWFDVFERGCFAEIGCGDLNAIQESSALPLIDLSGEDRVHHIGEGTQDRFAAVELGKFHRLWARCGTETAVEAVVVVAIGGVAHGG
jgi:hypothetical protein